VSEPNAHAASRADLPADDGYPLRGTVVLTLLYLAVIVLGWGYVYLLMIRRG